MKLLSNASDSEIYEFNSIQIETNRKESEEVKRCFTTQIHQTFIASAAILTVGVTLLRASDFGWHALMLATFMTTLLAIASMDVGCHKLNTSNRAIAFQIHLARTVDYEEANLENGVVINRELRRIDWEEAMFAWRIVQPVIFNFFYVKHEVTGVWGDRLSKSEKMTALAAELGVSKKVFCQSFAEYPWHDSDALLKTEEFQKKPGGPSAKFYPGTYLEKMTFLLLIQVMLCLSILVFCWAVVTAEGPEFARVLSGAGLLLLGVFVGIRIFNNYARIKILESGLCSIQTSAFVWRMVCLAHVLARLRATEKNRVNAQAYAGYTQELAGLACGEFRQNLHNVHKWMYKCEAEIGGLLEKGRVCSQKQIEAEMKLGA